MAVRIEAQSEPIPGYKLLERLGAGGFGEVWKAEAPGGIFKAIKIIHGDLRSKDNDVVRYAEQELKSLKRVQQVRHPYLLALDRYDIIDGRLMITMELADCNLWDRFREYRGMGLPGIPRDELLLYMTETAEVLDLFNEQFQLQHLDIKPQNLFLLYNHVKVADFGQVKDLQGLLATVTGGITPVYAAPETFEGVITRYCDQYSLACVYQELLTGQRPFDGSSMSQLLMQHLSLPPNLNPSPSADRPILARALAKKPEERWPSVSEFVRKLIGVDPTATSRPSVPGKPSYDAPTSFAPERRPLPPAALEPPRGPAVPLPRLVVPGSAAHSPSAPNETPPRGSTADDAGPAFLPVPAEEAGEGPLRPALVIGLGQVGMRVLQRLRFDLTELYGAPDTIPIVRMLYVDVDPDAVADAVKPRPRERLAGLNDAEVLPTPMNRPQHYAKPRLNGRSLTEGWFEPQLLYKMPPRGSTTMGVRPLGRLAFCDHYRTVMARVQTLVEQSVTPEALAKTEARTGLARRSNRPRVYVVAGLAGGTGGGMFLDAAYAVRNRLQRMGYDDPEVIGLLFVPPSDAALTPPQALGNTYASLLELNHFARPDTTFVAGYDERNGVVREKAPPFTQCFLFQGTAAGLKLPGSSSRSRSAETLPHGADTLPPKAKSGPIAPPAPRSAVGHQRPLDHAALMEALRPYGTAADLIRLNLFTLVGKTADGLRGLPADELPPQGVTLSAFGTAAFGWPRAEVVTRTAVMVGHAVLQRWAAPDLQRIREVIPTIAQDKWTQLKLNPEVVQGRLQLAADLACERVEEQIIQIADPLVPRGWLARLPDPGLVNVALDKLLKLLGPPASTSKRTPTPVEQALNQVVQETGAAFAASVAAFVPSLVNDPRFRLAGTEEMIRQFLAVTDRLLDEYLKSVADFEAKAQTGFERVSQYAYFSKDKKKIGTTEFGEAIKQFPRSRFQSMLLRSMVAVYQILRKSLDDRLAEVSDARKRLVAAAEASQAPVPPTAEAPAGTGPRLMPPGCSTVSEAVDRFLAVLTEADLGEIDRRVQRAVDRGLGGVIQACRTTATGPEHVVAAVYEETRAHLDLRLGRVDLAAMFAERYRTVELAEEAVAATFQEAEPSWVGRGPWAAAEITVFGCPCDPGGEALQELAQRAIPVPGLPLADTPDDLIVYREWPAVPLAALAQLGPAAATAYQAMTEAQQGAVHSRLDVTRWVGVDDRD